MVNFFLRLALFARTLVRLWRSDPDFRTLVILVFFTLLSGTIFYSLQEGWSVVDAFYFSATTLTIVGSRRFSSHHDYRQVLDRHLHLQRTRPHRRLHKYDSEGDFEQADEEAEERGDQEDTGTA